MWYVRFGDVPVFAVIASLLTFAWLRRLTRGQC